MVSPRMKVTQLDSMGLEKLRALESELRCCVVAFEPAAKIAQLSAEQFARLQFFERELGVALVAYQPMTTLRLAVPTAEQMKRIQEIERELNLVVVAYELTQPRDEGELTSKEGLYPAQLSEHQFARLQSAEEQMGVVLLAVRHNDGSDLSGRSVS